jgi:hypothetical protein
MPEQDRISFSFGRKLSTPIKYEMADVHISLSTDVRKGETIEQAIARAAEIVEKQVLDKCDEIRDSFK